MQIPVRIIQSIRAPSPFMKSMPEVIMSAISDPKIPVLIKKIYIWTALRFSPKLGWANRTSLTIVCVVELILALNRL